MRAGRVRTVVFHSTRWSLVFRTAEPGEPGRLALAELCRAYWQPVHAFFVCAVRDRERALDLTQGLFLRLLERHDFAAAAPERGRFRNWLCACARHHLADDVAHGLAEKRGGGAEVFSLDVATEDAALREDPVDPQATPEQAFTQRWVRAVIDRALARVGLEWEQRGRGRVFAVARGCLDGDGLQSLAALAERLGMTEGAFKVAVHRLRDRLREVLQDEVRQTLEAPDEATDEIGFLLATLAGRKIVLGP